MSLARSLLFLLAPALIAAACVGRVYQANPTPIPTPVPFPTVDPAQGPLPPTEAINVAIDCLDADHNGRIDAADLRTGTLTDLTLDRKVDDTDVRAVQDTNIQLVAPCDGKPQFRIYPLDRGVPDCAADARFAVVLGITGAAPDGLSDGRDGKGVREIIDAVRASVKSAGYGSAVYLSTPDLPAASNEHTAMETWLVDVLRAALDSYPCARLVIVGHSHGAASALAVTTALEDHGYAKRIAQVAIIDRVTLRYKGNATAVPRTAPVLHFFQRNEQDLSTDVCAKDAAGNPTVRGQNGEGLGTPAASNIVEKDLSDRGLCHSTIDDDPAVQAAIVSAVTAALQAPAR